MDLNNKDIIVLKKVLKMAIRGAKSSDDIKYIRYLQKEIRANEKRILEQRKIIAKMFTK